MCARSVVLTAVLLAVTGCASTGPQHSGFIQNEPVMQEQKDAEGTVSRYVSPALSTGAFKAVLVDPVQFYPAPQPSEKVDAATLKQIQGYLDQAWRRELGTRIGLASGPGPGVARVRTALTGVKAESADLKPYQYLPAALVATAAAEAAGLRSKDVRLFVEVEVTDSVTGERLAVAVREGSGEKIKGGAQDKVTLQTVRPLIDQLAASGATVLASAMQGR
jgi:hypothetical protein